MSLERDLIGYVIGGSLKEGITVRLTVPATMVREGGFVVIESLGVRYYGLSVNLSLRSADPRFSLERAELRFKPAYAAVLNEKALYTEMEVMPVLMQETGGDIDDPDYQPQDIENPGIMPIKTVPAHHAPVYLASRFDVAAVFSPRSAGGKSDASFMIGTTREQGHPVHINLKKLIERSSGIFGATGTGKSYLTRLILAGLLKSGEASVLVFDMHNEYSYGDRSPDTGKEVPGLKDKFGPKVMLAGLGAGAKIRSRRVDIELVLKSSDLYPSDIEMLTAELNLRDTTGTTLNQLFQAFGTDWFEAFRKLGSGGEDELAQWARDNKLHEGAVSALYTKLGKVFGKPYIRPNVAGDPVGNIINVLSAGKSVVLSFGGYESDLDYLLVTNVLTRLIRAEWERRTNEGYHDPLKNPYPLVIALEEAHKLLNREMASQTAFAAIAREMRKYSVTLLVIDQRPSQIYDEVMSQLGTRISGWLGDDNDIAAVLSGLSGRDTLRGMLSRLQPKEEVLLVGYGVPMPLPVRSRRYDEAFWRELFGTESGKPEDAALSAKKFFG